MEMLPVAILAGGLATRLRPLTATIPKALLDIDGEPFIAHQLRLLASRSVERCVLCVGHLGEQVRDFAGDGNRFGMRVDYSFDGPALRGTAGAIRNALPLLGDSFFVLYGDSYLPCNYEAIAAAFAGESRQAMMTVFRNRGAWDRSNVLFAGGVIRAYDKRNPDPRMEHIDYGLGAFRRAVFEGSGDGGPADLAEVYQDLLRSGELAGMEVPERFYEIGSHEGLAELRAYLERVNSR